MTVCGLTWLRAAISRATKNEVEPASRTTVSADAASAASSPAKPRRSALISRRLAANALAHGSARSASSVSIANGLPQTRETSHDLSGQVLSPGAVADVNLDRVDAKDGAL